MNILFATHQTAFQQCSGGGEVQLTKTASALQASGVTVDQFDPFMTQIHKYDLLHVFSSHPDLLTLVNYAKEVGVPSVVSTIYYDNVYEIFRHPFLFLRSIQDYPYSFSDIVSKGLERLAPERLVEIIDRKKRLYEAAAGLFPNSSREEDLLKRRFDISGEKVHVIPNGVDARFADATPDVFEASHDAKDFVLMVCSIDPRKNLITALKALSGLGKDIVVIGAARDGKAEDRQYAAQFERTAEAVPEDVYLLGHVDHESDLLASAYAACDVFLLPSWFETPGLAALEAGLAGANVVVTNFGPTEEYFGEHAYYVNPASKHSIRDAVRRAAESESDTELRRHIRENYLWNHVGERTETVYEHILHD